MAIYFTERERIALGLRPRTMDGWWFWLRYWSPFARLFRYLKRRL